LAKEILAATTPITTSGNDPSTRVRGQRQFGLFGSLGSGFGAAASGAGSGFGNAVKGVGDAFGSALYGPAPVQTPIVNSISVAINNAEKGTAVSTSGAQNQNQNQKIA